MNLKNKLLELNLVHENEYLDKYVQLVETNGLSNTIKFQTDVHHIVPAFFYRSWNRCVDNSPLNLVILQAKDHVLAHFLLALCATERYVDAATRAAHRVATGHEGSYNNVLEALDLLDWNELQLIHEQNKKAASEWSKTTVKNKGKIWINNGIQNRMVFPEEFAVYESKNFVKGRLPLPTDGIEKMRQSRKGQKPSQDTIDKRKATMIARYGKAGVNNCTDESNSRISKTLQEYYSKNVHVNSGKIAICNDTLEKTKYILEDEFPKWESCGWRRGRGSFSTAQKHCGNNTMYIHKGTKIKRIQIVDYEMWESEGWLPRRK